VAETGLNHGALAADSQGRVTVAWAEQDGPRANFQIYTQVREPGGFWQSPELAVAFDTSYAGSTLGAKFPALAHVADDSLLMVWHDYRVGGILNLELFTKIRGPGEAWGDSTGETRLTHSNHPETLGDNSYVPGLAVTPDGSAHTVWYDYRFEADHAEILFKSRVDGGWDLTPGDAPDTNLSINAGESHFPAITTGPDGSLHVAWRDDTGGWFRIAYRSRNTGGVWSATEWLSPDGVTADGVALAVASDGAVIAVWSDTRTGSKAVYSRERASGSGVWGPPMRVSPDGVGAEEPAVAVGPTGRRRVAWQDARVSVFNREIFHQAMDAGGVWDSTGVSDFQVSAGSGKSSRPTLLAVGAEAFVVWQDARHGAEEIYFRALSGDVTAVSGPEGWTNRPRLTAWPNPFRNTLEIRSESGLPIDVWDVRGRRVATLFPRGNSAVGNQGHPEFPRGNSGWGNPGNSGFPRGNFQSGDSQFPRGNTVRWNGMTDANSPLPAGVYFLRERGSASAPVRVVRLP